MRYYSMPADFKKETIDGYVKLNEKYSNSKILETYGQATVETVYTAGRLLEDIPQVGMNQLEEYVKYSKERGIDFSYNINGTCMGNKEFTEEGIIELKLFLSQLYNIGIRNLTVAMPSLIELVKSTGYDFKIKASTLCEITNPNKASAFKRIGVERIVVQESINREFSNLKKIVDVFGDKVEIIINTLCHQDCIYRMYHYNQMSHHSVKNKGESITSHYNHLCMKQRCRTVEDFMKLSWVRPEDIKYYSEIGINRYKIQGRHTVLNGDPIRVAETYFKESYDGNLLELLELFNVKNSFKIDVDNKKLDKFILPFVNNENFCKRDCINCNYCKGVIEKCTDYNASKEVNRLALEFYDQYDPYINKLREIQPEKDLESIDNSIEKEIGFNFNF